MFVPRDPTHNDITVSVEATGDLASLRIDDRDRIAAREIPLDLDHAGVDPADVERDEPGAGRTLHTRRDRGDAPRASAATMIAA